MRILNIVAALCAQTVFASTTSEQIDGTTVYFQPVTSSSAPVNVLAEITFNPSTLVSSLASFEPPELSRETKLVRIGVYDSANSSWKSSTSVTSAENFAKGFSPTIVLTLDARGEVVGVTLKSGKIDAGQTRDFGPKVKVVRTTKGKKPELNRPIVLSKEGKVEQPEPEKTMLQKYWWVILGGVMLLMTAGGGGE